ncbi:MAG: peptide MFS transporter [bacterium]|nr:peptide MFS transporter [bacterium]
MNQNNKKSGELFGHPKGLYVLFLTEMWERFSFYGMRAILVLYMIGQLGGDNPGLGWEEASALGLYGWYTMSVYVMSIPGGLLADRLIGQKKAVFVGGLLLVAGHGILAFDALWAFYLGMVLIVLGVGSLKPNISTMVGGLYKEGDPRRDMGFSIFYIGINVGAMLAALIVGWVGETQGWHYGFGLAGIGMALGQLVFMLGQKHLKGIGDFVKPGKKGGVKTRRKLTKVEKDRMVVMLLSFLIIIVFWGAFEQAGGLMNIYTQQKVDRVLLGIEIPASVFQALNPAYILLFAVPVAWMWRRRQKKKKESSSLFKMALGTMIMGVGFLMMTGASMEAGEAGKASLYWIFGAYLLHTIGELCVSPVALSFITKLTPVKYASLMMGTYFAATGIGNKLAGILGEAAESAGELEIFLGIFVFTVIFGLLLLAFMKKLKAMTHGAEDVDETETDDMLEKVAIDGVDGGEIVEDNV